MPDAQNTEDSDARFKNGDVILGHYTVVKQLGRGGMGTVYLARDDVSGQEVAVKVLPASLARERDIRERFIQEARALASMDHPNIVPLVTFAEEGEDRFLVMKYLQGESLDARLRRITVLPPEHARKILRAVLSALGYAHSRGVIHRDVKPSNVLIEGDLDGEHRVFLVDFGIAKKDAVDGEDAHKLTQTGMLMGTPQYMSPEQISGQRVDGRSDVYAAGLVLFEMLSGRPPFDGQKTFQVLRAHVEQAVPDVREARGSPIPDDLVAITYLLLRKDPNERPQNALEAIGLLDGTGSFPTLKPELTTPSTASIAPPAMPSWPPMAPTQADDSGTGSTKSVPTVRANADASLDDPSMEEIAAVRQRGRSVMFVAVLVLGAAAATGLVLFKPWQRVDTTVTTNAPVVDSGSVEQSTDKAAMLLLVQTARSALKSKDDQKAYDAIAAVVDKAPNDPEALSLQVDVCTAMNKLDEADAALASLKKLIALGGVEPPIIARVPEQEAALAARRAAPKPKVAEPPRPKIERASTGPSDSSVIAQAKSTRAAVGSCYSELVQVKDPGASGELTFAVRIAPAGRVDAVELSKNTGGSLFDSPAFKKCVERQVKKWRFSPWHGEATTVPYQIQFSPR